MCLLNLEITQLAYKLFNGKRCSDRGFYYRSEFFGCARFANLLISNMEETKILDIFKRYGKELWFS